VSRTPLARDSVVSFKTLFLILFLLFNALSWHYLTWRAVRTKYMENPVVLGIYDSAVILSGIVGSIFSSRIKRLRLLYVWTFVGIITSFLLTIPSDDLWTALIFSFSLGFSFGFGMPCCLSLFADYTDFENRGRMGGIAFLATNLSAPFIISLPTTDPLVGSLISSVWRALGLIVLFLTKPSAFVPEKRKHVTFKFVFNNRSFLLYLIPWLMFSLIDGFEKVVFGTILEPDFFAFLLIVGAIIGTVSALVSGVMSDYVGRKRVVIYGFVSLGLAYAVIGIAPANLISWYFYSVIDGIAWGVFTVSFFLVLWGDLSSDTASEKYYAIGSIPFFLAELMGFLFAPLASIPANAAFSVASLFLFVAVLPLMYAPETMPERKIEFRRLRKYVEKAKKVREKYVEKGSEN